jgi:hypothetical protein
MSSGLLSVEMADQLKVYREHVGKIAYEGLEAFQSIAGTDGGASFEQLLDSQKSPELSEKVKILINLAMTVHDFAESASRFSRVGQAGSVLEGLDQGALLKIRFPLSRGAHARSPPFSLSTLLSLHPPLFSTQAHVHDLQLYARTSTHGPKPARKGAKQGFSLFIGS